MKRSITKMFVTMAVLAMAVPVFAGEGHHKCDASAQECINYMAQKFENKGWLGVELDKTDSGVLSIVKVVPASPAEKAGLKVGEKLVALNGIQYNDENKEALKAAYKEFTPGNAVSYTLASGGVEREVKVTLGTMPNDVKAKWIGAHVIEHHVDVAAVN